ncbi:hypothetical protein CHCC20375_2864 [Bacillus licheniformis]|nr:hypothetical protein CHCC20375_2864 [Bacillus licheniformis]
MYTFSATAVRFFHMQPIPFFQDVIYFTTLPFFSQIEKARCTLTQRA